MDKKKKIITLTAILGTGLASFCVSQNIVNNKYKSKAEKGNFQIDLGASKDKQKFEKDMSLIKTSAGNNVKINYSLLEPVDNAWAKITGSSTHGYFEIASGEITNTNSYFGALNGLTNITMDINGGYTLYYGHDLNNPSEPGIKKLFNQNYVGKGEPVTFDFNNTLPNYIRIEANSDTDVIIEELKFEYSCNYLDNNKTIHIINPNPLDGSVIVEDTKEVTTESYETFNTAMKSKVKLKAKSASGSFLHWEDEDGNILSEDIEFELELTKDKIVKPVFKSMVFTYDDEHMTAVVGDNHTSSKARGDLIIPATVNHDGKEYTVVGISNKAFRLCSDLTSVQIPSSVSSIGEQAFSNCKKLTSVDIPNSVTSIGKGAFEICSNLTSVNIPEGITTINENTFLSCRSLVSIDIPNGVTSIGAKAFSSCTGLTSINIPNSVTSIGDRAFYDCESLGSITIPEGVTSISSGTFASCTSLTSISIPSGVTSIGEGAFASCTSLVSFKIPSGVKTIAKDTFNGCICLLSVEIPNSVTTIARNAFSKCGLIYLNLPSNLTTIEENAFSYCVHLSSLYIPNNVTSINHPFVGCSALYSIEVAEDNLFYDSRNNCNGIIERLSNTLILGCKNTVIPESVTAIGEYAYAGCDILTTFVVPENIQQIGKYAFQDCSELVSINMSNGVNSIGEHAFDSCIKLESIGLSSSISKIMPYTFYGCVALKNVDLPHGVTEICEGAFSGCISLVDHFKIPKGVTSIGSRAFDGCKKIQEIIIPDTVTAMGEHVFYDCTIMYRIFCEATSQPEGWDAKWMDGTGYSAMACWYSATPNYDGSHWAYFGDKPIIWGS